jgi:hypothetical protein
MVVSPPDPNVTPRYWPLAVLELLLKEGVGAAVGPSITKGEGNPPAGEGLVEFVKIAPMECLDVAPPEFVRFWRDFMLRGAGVPGGVPPCERGYKCA